MKVNDEILTNIYIKGKYYNPAWKHYGNETNVVCDRCKTTQLDISVGWEDYDLCILCINQLSEIFKQQSSQQSLQQSHKEAIATISKSPTSNIRKKMRQRMFTK